MPWPRDSNQLGRYGGNPNGLPRAAARCLSYQQKDGTQRILSSIQPTSVSPVLPLIQRPTKPAPTDCQSHWPATLGTKADRCDICSPNTLAAAAATAAAAAHTLGTGSTRPNPRPPSPPSCLRPQAADIFRHWPTRQLPPTAVGALFPVERPHQNPVVTVTPSPSCQLKLCESLCHARNPSPHPLILNPRSPLFASIDTSQDASSIHHQAHPACQRQSLLRLHPSHGCRRHGSSSQGPRPGVSCSPPPVPAPVLAPLPHSQPTPAPEPCHQWPDPACSGFVGPGLRARVGQRPGGPSPVTPSARKTAGGAGRAHGQTTKHAC